MTETKRVMCMTEWEVTMRNGARTVDIRTASVPDEVERVADELQKSKRPEPLTVEEALGIWDHYFTCHGGISSVLQAERKRQAEIAAWDAEHGPKTAPAGAPVLRRSGAPPIWYRPGRTYAETGYYWRKLHNGDVWFPEFQDSGNVVPSDVEFIAGPIQNPVHAWDLRCDGAEHGSKTEASDAPVWVEAPKVYPEDGWYWNRNRFGSVFMPDFYETGVPVSDRIDGEVTHIAGPIHFTPPVDP